MTLTFRLRTITGRMDNSTINPANPESLLGMLQRGRGKGFLAALEVAPQAVWPLLFECITYDPRREPQWEPRAAYYASLMAATHMDFEPLHEYVVQHDGSDEGPDPDIGLPLATLLSLSYLVDDDQENTIEQIVRGYVSYGRAWKRVLKLLADIDTPEGMAQALAAICRRARGDPATLEQFKGQVRADWKAYIRENEETRARCSLFLPICEPWKTICVQNPEFAGLFRSVGIAYDQAPPPPDKPSREYLASLSLEDLFTKVDGSNLLAFRRALPEKVAARDEGYLLRQFAADEPSRMMLALRGLAKLGTPRAFAAVKTFLESSEDIDRTVRMYAEWAIEEMPGALTLDTARQWFQCKEHRLQWAGADIMGRHAVREDVPLLIEALRTPDAFRGEDPRLSGVLGALARFEGFGRIAELEQFFCRVENSFWRNRAAEAMAATAPAEFASEYACECLWDCDEHTRIVGCRTVNLSIPRVLERIKEIVADENDSEEVQHVAVKRLEELTP